MRLWDLPRYIPIQVAESLSDRFMDSEELYVRFLKKLKRQAFAELKEAASKGDWQLAGEKAHNLKGVTANLGLVRLWELFASLVNLIRGKSFSEREAAALLEVLEAEWEKTLACIDRLDG